MTDLSNTPSQTPAGWYHAEGDPAGTQRWWDGSQWIGGPQHNAPTSGVPGGLASPWKRIGARVIDALITGILFSIPMMILMFSRIDFSELTDEIDSGSGDFTSFEASLTEALDLNPLYFVAVGIGSFVWDWLWVALKGATPGKLMVGTRVATLDEREIPPGHRSGVLRALNRAVGAVPVLGFIVWPIGLASLIMLFAQPERRTVMDFIGGTVVIDKP